MGECLREVRVIITGGAGFIGSHLTEKLLNLGAEITVLDNFSTGRKNNLKDFIKNINLIEADISEKGDWQKCFQDADWVIHLAALADIVPSIENPRKYFESNVTGTLNVLEAAKKSNIKRLIYSASSSCYGIPENYPTSENSQIDTRYPYALTKYLGEELVLHWEKVFKIPSISLRFFNVYGTKSRTSGTYGAVFGVFLAQKLKKKPFTVVGDGTQTRDFTYVSDVVEAIVAAAKSNISGEIINIGSDNTYTVNQLVDLLGGEVIYIPKRPGEPDCTWADITKAKKMLDWTPKISLSDGVKFLLEDIDYWKEAPVWDEESINNATKKWFKYLG
tara:strand:+ start:645 stop:1643 length:999 start_codon:yes stop_codon:yes gene_type:complete